LRELKLLTLGFTVQAVCVAALAFGLLPKCKAAQPNLTRLLLADAVAMLQRWAVTPWSIKPTGVAIIVLMRTKHDKTLPTKP
jgi:hypothetical protein